jgi:hypothetical protein
MKEKNLRHKAVVAIVWHNICDVLILPTNSDYDNIMMTRKLVKEQKRN